jgi:hypothetical protein
MINPLFKELIDNPEVKFTIILGSGFHSQALDRNSILSSWSALLEKVSQDVKLTKDLHLDFERIIASKKRENQDSSKAEGELITCLTEDLKLEQKDVLAKYSNCYPLQIFNPNKVTDVISLNFDQIPEKLLSNQKGTRLSGFVNKSSFSKRSKRSYPYLSTRYRLMDFGLGKGEIRFWHPHGVIENNKSIVLGLHKYSNLVKTTIKIRDHHLQNKKEGGSDLTWYQSLLTNPVLILGAGLSSNEWDMWFALTSRNRANKITPPIFQMRVCECKNDARHQWFEPLFNGLSYEQQWEELKKIFAKKINSTK